MHFRLFDAWRFTAAILIMAYHFLHNGPAVEATPGIAFLFRLLPLLDMFFMMSGFFIAARYGRRLATPADYAGFLRRRVARIYPLHLLTLAFFTAMALVFATGLVETQEPERWDLAALPYNLLALHALGFTDHLTFNYPSWSVSAEFFCYALFPLTILAFRSHGLKGLVILLLVWLAGLEAASAAGLFDGAHWSRTNTFGAWRAFADFTLGAVAAALLERRVLDTRSFVPGLLFLGFAVLAMIGEWGPYAAILGFFGAIYFTALAETARPDATAWLAPFATVTRVSFGIYLWHPVMEVLFLSLLWKRWLGSDDLLGFYAFMTVPMVASVVVAVLSDRFVEPHIARLIAGPRRPEAGGKRLSAA